MARKPRDYAAEYARRIQKGLERGLNKAQARGHPRKQYGELGAREVLKARKEQKPIELHPKSYKERIQRAGGTYAGKGKWKYNEAKFPDLDSAYKFIRQLSKNQKVQLRQYGYLIHFTHNDSDQVGEFATRNLSLLSSAKVLIQEEQTIRQNSAFRFDQNSPTEFTVAWKKI
jgi:hypothetical protein